MSVISLRPVLMVTCFVYNLIFENIFSRGITKNNKSEAKKMVYMGFSCPGLLVLCFVHNLMFGKVVHMSHHSNKVPES